MSPMIICYNLAITMNYILIFTEMLWQSFAHLCAKFCSYTFKLQNGISTYIKPVFKLWQYFILSHPVYDSVVIVQCNVR